jgi:hypothetical protein
MFWPKYSQHVLAHDWRKCSSSWHDGWPPAKLNGLVNSVTGFKITQHYFVKAEHEQLLGDYLQLEKSQMILRKLADLGCRPSPEPTFAAATGTTRGADAYKVLLELAEAGDAPLRSTPGDPLQPVLPFAEFEPQVLFREEVWPTIAVSRTVMLKDIKSGATRSLLRHVFFDGGLLTTLRTATGKASRTWSALLATIGTATGKATQTWKGQLKTLGTATGKATQTRSLLATLRTAMTRANMRQPRPRRQPLIHVWESYDTLQSHLVLTDVGSSSCQVLSWKTLSCGTSSSICGVNPPTLKLVKTNRHSSPAPRSAID